MKILQTPSIWDLHIHTNKCPKGSSEFVEKYNKDTKGFIDELLKILQPNGENIVELISFTDHNYISLETYEEFSSRDTQITLIPGVEIDTLISDDSKVFKHVIFYFDCPKEDWSILAKEVNEILKPSRECDEPLNFNFLINSFLQLGYRFTISPHAFKQGKRAIDREWLDEKETSKNAKFYTDQFFSFWESSGINSMHKAKEYLESFKLEDKISIVSFSDSNNFEKLKSYLSSPPQYFRSLSSYKGITMIGNEPTRITKEKVIFPEETNPSMIYEIIFEDNAINLSKQLNTIIGGRGSGKSILLDSIALKLGDKTLENTDRFNYLKEFNIELRNFNNVEINEGFSIDYFNQAYVNELFSSSKTEYNKKLKEKFSDSFNKLEQINTESIVSNNLSKFKDLIKEVNDYPLENINAFTNSYFKINNDSLNVNILKRERTPITNKVRKIDYKEQIEKIDKYFNSLPIQIKENKNILTSKNVMKKVIVNEIYNYNIEAEKTIFAKNKIINNFHEMKDNVSKISKEKSNLEEKIETYIFESVKPVIKRNNLINAYLKISKDFKKYYSDFVIEDGSMPNRFVFSNELTIQSPIEYLIETINESLNKNKEVMGNHNFRDICKLYITGDIKKFLKDSSSIEVIDNNLLAFELGYNLENNIYYNDEGTLKNLLNESPGTKTNILMEYIVYKKTNRPLLIDQPEDNIDNKTIYKELREWFSRLKNERQVIVVTHDANIVINSDAENVIIAEQLEVNKFSYTYGALEYGDILESASVILDGGKEAVERRLNKYES